MAPDRWVVVDDTDSSVKYTGSWFQDSSDSQDNIGGNGPPYLHTLHGTSTANATVEFEFKGTAFEVRGTNVVDGSSINGPTFECFVDSVSIHVDSNSVLNENNWRFCGLTQLPDTLHTLRFDVKSIPENHTFWLDQLRYIPSPGSPLDNKTILLNNIDPAVRFDSQWTSVPGHTANMTTQNNSIARVDFVGISISWVAFVPFELPHVATIATWTIDSGEPTQFPLPGPFATYNQFYFTTPDLQTGPHTLTVAFLGDNHTTPLVLDYLLVKNGTFPHPVAKNTVKPAILGGVLGGAAFLIVILGAILFCWRRRKVRWKEGYINMEGPRYYVPIFFNPSRSAVNRRADTHKPPLQSASGISSDVTPAGATSSAPGPRQLGPMRKQRETSVGTVSGEAGQTEYSNVIELSPSPPLPPPPLIPQPQSQPQPQEAATTNTNEIVHQHLDSGLRLNTQSVVDVPPLYTPY